MSPVYTIHKIGLNSMGSVSDMINVILVLIIYLFIFITHKQNGMIKKTISKLV